MRGCPVANVITQFFGLSAYITKVGFGQVYFLYEVHVSLGLEKVADVCKQTADISRNDGEVGLIIGELTCRSRMWVESLNNKHILGFDSNVVPWAIAICIVAGVCDDPEARISAVARSVVIVVVEGLHDVVIMGRGVLMVFGAVVVRAHTLGRGV